MEKEKKKRLRKINVTIKQFSLLLLNFKKFSIKEFHIY